MRALAETVRTRFPDETSELSGDELHKLLRAAVARARRHGLTWESAIAGFVTLMFNIAPNFDEHPAFQRVLANPALSEEDRVAAVFSQVTPEEWEQAEDAYDDSAWGLSGPEK